MLSYIEFSVDSFPPAYDSALSISNKNHRRHHLVVLLQEKAKAAMNGSELLKGDLKLEAKCESTIDNVATDCLNLVGGIGNSLQGIVYCNDNQIKEIHFKQLLSSHNRYTLRVSKVGHY